MSLARTAKLITQVADLLSCTTGAIHAPILPPYPALHRWGWSDGYDGLHSFSSSGDPLESASFSALGQSFNNLPNENDRYQMSGGSVTRMKYDLFGGDNGLNLRLDGTYEVVDLRSDPLETGTYTISSSGPPGTSNHLFSNQPNQNDRYVVSGGRITALKFDLFASGYDLLLRSDGSFEVNDGFTGVGGGTYSLSTVPEVESIGGVAGLLLLGWTASRRSR